MKKPAQWGRFRHGAAIYARVQTFLSRPMIGHTPRKLPLSSNLPVHRRARRRAVPSAACPYIIIEFPARVKRNFAWNSKNFLPALVPYLNKPLLPLPGPPAGGGPLGRASSPPRKNVPWRQETQENFTKRLALFHWLWYIAYIRVCWKCKIRSGPGVRSFS